VSWGEASQSRAGEPGARWRQQRRRQQAGGAMHLVEGSRAFYQQGSAPAKQREAPPHCNRLAARHWGKCNTAAASPACIPCLESKGCTH
jgi:hypothetical protein